MDSNAADGGKMIRFEAPIRRPTLSDRQGFNRRWFAPELEQVCAVSDAAALTAAVDRVIGAHGSAFSLVSGRHCYENFVYRPGVAALIDVSGMTGLGVDPARGFYVDAGNSNWSMYLGLLNQYNRTLPAGSCYSVGTGGHICGGGYGLLSRLHGLTVDWLSGVDIVVKPSAAAPARMIHVSKHSTGMEADLFWACRGGGGSFGAIARYYFEELPPAPAEALQASLTFDWADVTSVATLSALIGMFERYALPQDRELWPWFWMLKLTHRESGHLGVVVQAALEVSDRELLHAYQQRFESFKRDLSGIVPLHSRPRPLGGHPVCLGTGTAVSGEAQQFTFLEALQNVNGSGPNRRGKYKSAYMKKPLPTEQIKAIYAALTTSVPRADLSKSLLQVDSYGGQINTVAPTDTPIPQRSSVLKLQYQTYWQNSLPPGSADPAQDQLYLGWIRNFYRSVYATYGGVPDPARDSTGTVDGCYYNYPDVDLGVGPEVGTALQLYFGDNYRSLPRNLLAIKRAWDPNDYFHHAQSIA